MISVVVPIFRSESYLDECILSLLRQSERDLEIILVDDGSPDSCSGICDYYARLDGRIRVIHKERGGVSDARNVGVAAATGEAITFVDSDDFVSDEFISTLKKTFEQETADIAICGHARTNSRGKTYLPPAFHRRKKRTFSPREGISDLLSLGGYESFLWNKLFRRELFEGVAFPVGRLYEDFATTYKLFHRAEKLAFDPSPLYFYRQQKGSIIHRMNTEKSRDFITAAEEFRDFIRIHYPSFRYKGAILLFRTHLTSLFYRFIGFFSLAGRKVKKI